MNSLSVRFMPFDALLVDNLMVDLNVEINFGFRTQRPSGMQY